MSRYFFLIFVLMSLQGLNAADSSSKRSFNSELKRKLSFELSNLEISMLEAKNEIAQLREDKVHIDTDLKNMESWGKIEQEQKNEYYTRTVEATQQIADVQARVDLEKQKGKATVLRYHRVKSLLGYIFGLLLVFVYVQIGAPLINVLLTTFTGPWGFLIRFLGPVIVFGLGYTAVYITF